MITAEAFFSIAVRSILVLSIKVLVIDPVVILTVSMTMFALFKNATHSSSWSSPRRLSARMAAASALFLMHLPGSFDRSSRYSSMKVRSRASFLVPALVSPYPLQSKPSSRSTLASTSPMLSPRALSVVPFMVTPPPVHG